MAHAICLQDWTTAQGGANVVLTQGEQFYADCSGFQDLVPYVEISAISGAAATLSLQTSPTRDENFFKTLSDAGGVGVNYTVVGVQAVKYIRYAFASIPMSQLVRWTATGTAAWSITFRVWLSLNQSLGAGAGGAPPPRLARTSSMSYSPPSSSLPFAAHPYPTSPMVQPTQGPRGNPFGPPRRS